MSPRSPRENDGQTVPTRQEEREPRLPHERDESADSQHPQPEAHQRIGRQAHEDVERGLVDTDRGPELERINDEIEEQAHHRPAHKRGA